MSSHPQEMKNAESESKILEYIHARQVQGV